MVNSHISKENTPCKEDISSKTYNIGCVVPCSGFYVCVPCGYKKYFERGGKFTRCFGCLENKKNEGDHYFKDLGLWELVNKKK